MHSSEDYDIYKAVAALHTMSLQQVSNNTDKIFYSKLSLVSCCNSILPVPFSPELLPY